MMRFVGVAMFIPMIVAFLYKEVFFVELFGFMGVLIFVLFSVLRIKLGKQEVRFRHAIISIALAWFVIGIISAVPFLFVGMTPIDSFFESVSGWTGTGLSMISAPQNLPFALNFWRGFIQWIGGFGIVLLALLLFEKPQTAHHLFAAEGRIEEFSMNVVKVARTILMIYFGYTILGIILFLFSGLNFFDAVVHTFTSIATGGFSTNSVGVGFYGSNAMIVSILLMAIGGISFESHYDLIHGKIKRFLSNPEIKFFFGIILLATALVSVNLFIFKNNSFFDAFFYIISSITGTGATTFFTLDKLPALSIFILILLMIFGSCFGSTAGALKIWRIIILFRVIRREIHKAFLPKNTVFPIKIGNRTVCDEDAMKALSYLALYLFFLVIGSVIFMLWGYGLIESVFVVASAQGNVGLTLFGGDSWYLMDPILKFLLSLHMILGRMEILPFLIMIKSFGFGSKI
jgi:trk system potassium uptake protein TrkH